MITDFHDRNPRGLLGMAGGFVPACGVFLLALAACDSRPPASAGDDGYPLKTCVVSGEPLDSMGGPVVLQQDGKTVKFCCEACIDEFKKDPAPYLDKLTHAAAR